MSALSPDDSSAARSGEAGRRARGELEAAGARALPIVGEIREEESVLAAGTLELPMKRYDLKQDINARGTFLVSRG